MGTAFIACPQSGASAEYRAALGRSAVAGTQVTRILSGRPARRVANATLDVLAPHEAELPDYPLAYHAGKVLADAGAATGYFDFAPYWAGQAAPLSRALPAGEFVQHFALSVRAALEAAAHSSGTAKSPID